jgi:hypothetical protein
MKRGGATGLELRKCRQVGQLGPMRLRGRSRRRLSVLMLVLNRLEFGCLPNGRQVNVVDTGARRRTCWSGKWEKDMLRLRGLRQ